LVLKADDRAIEDFTEAVRLDQRLAESYRLRGDVYAKREDYGKAVSDYTAALKTISSQRNLSKPRRRLHELNRNAEAVSDYSQAIRLRLDDFESWKGRGLASRLWDAIATPLRIWTRPSS